MNFGMLNNVSNVLKTRSGREYSRRVLGDVERGEGRTRARRRRGPEGSKPLDKRAKRVKGNDGKYINNTNAAYHTPQEEVLFNKDLSGLITQQLEKVGTLRDIVLFNWVSKKIQAGVLLRRLMSQGDVYTVRLRTVQDFIDFRNLLRDALRVKLPKLRIEVCRVLLLDLEKFNGGREALEAIMHVRRKNGDDIVLRYWGVATEVIVPGWATEVTMGSIYIKGNVTVQAGVERLKLQSVCGELELENGVKKLQIDAIQRNATVVVPESVERVEVRRLVGALDLRRASRLTDEKCTIHSSCDHQGKNSGVIIKND